MDIEVGAILEGTVTSIAKFGAFVSAKADLCTSPRSPRPMSRT